MNKYPLTLVALVCVLGSCDPDAEGGKDAAIVADVGTGGQDGTARDAASGGVGGALDSRGDGSTDAARSGCYPECIELLRQNCEFVPGESCVQDMLSMVSGARLQNCYSGGIREFLYDEVLPEGTYSTTRRTRSDGATTCFLQSQAKMGTRPFTLVRDASGKRVATIQPTAELGKPLATCIESGEAKIIDQSGPACSMSFRPNCQPGVCGQ